MRDPSSQGTQAPTRPHRRIPDRRRGDPRRHSKAVIGVVRTPSAGRHIDGHEHRAKTGIAGAFNQIVVHRFILRRVKLEPAVTAGDRAELLDINRTGGAKSNRHIRRLGGTGKFQLGIGNLETGQPHRRDAERPGEFSSENLNLRLHRPGLGDVARRHRDRIQRGSVTLLTNTRPGATIDIVIGKFWQPLLGGGMKERDARITILWRHSEVFLGEFD